MEERLKKHLDSLFAGAPDTEKMSEIKEEILQNTIDRYSDLIAEGKTEEEAYNTAIGGIGDLSQIIGDRRKNNVDEDGFSVGEANIGGNISSLEINWVSGSVKVEVYDGNETVLRETGYRNESERLRFKVSNGRLTVRFAKRFYNSFRNLSKDLTVKLPRSIASGLKELKIESVSARVSAGDVKADDLNVESVSGNIDIANISAAKSYVKNVSGKVTLSNLISESIYANNVSGGTEISSNASRIDCESISGCITVSTKKTPQKAKFHSVSGCITLSMPEESGFTAKLGSVSGRISSDFACTTEGKKFICGDGKSEISAETISGCLNIRKKRK